MNIDIFTLCDSAQQYDGGKLVIVGTFNNIYATKYPTMLPSLSLVSRIVFEEEENGIHDIEVCIKKRDSETFIFPTGKMEANTSSAIGERKAVNLIVNGNNVVIPSEGTYSVILKIDGKKFENILTARLKK